MERKCTTLNQNKSVTLLAGLTVAVFVLISFNTFQVGYITQPPTETQDSDAPDQEESGEDQTVISLEGLASFVQITISHFIINLFDVVFGESEKVYQDLEDLPVRLSYLKVLFSLIISPNAP